MSKLDNDQMPHVFPPPSTYAQLATSVSSFLAVCIHQILYLRSIYPQPTFIGVRKFNHPVRQSRHPRVCTWVSDACAAVEQQLHRGVVGAVTLHILAVRTNKALERYTFDMHQMPQVDPEDVHRTFHREGNNHGEPSEQNHEKAELEKQVDIEAQFRAVLARLASACARLTPLPPEEEYTATLQIILRSNPENPQSVENSDPNTKAHATLPPAGDTAPERLWIPVESTTPTLDDNGDPTNIFPTTRQFANSATTPAVATDGIDIDEDLLHPDEDGRTPSAGSGSASSENHQNKSGEQQQHHQANCKHRYTPSAEQLDPNDPTQSGQQLQPPSQHHPECPDFDNTNLSPDKCDFCSCRCRRRISRVQTKTVPVRKIDMGEVRLEVWVEEAKNKFDELDRIFKENPNP